MVTRAATPFGHFRQAWSALLLLVYHSLVITYMVNHIRRRDHIAIVQRGLAMFLVEGLVWMAIVLCYVVREWAVTTPIGYVDGVPQYYNSTPIVNVAEALWPSIGTVVTFTRMYTILAKFTKVPPMCALAEVRTTHGQVFMVSVAAVFALALWLIFQYEGSYLCMHVCGEPNTLPFSHYFLHFPFNIAFNAVLGYQVDKCKKAGAMAEASGILKSMDDAGKFLGPLLMSRTVLAILVDVGVIPFSLPAVQFFLFNMDMFVTFSLFYQQNYLPASTLGYSPCTCLNKATTSRVAPMEEEEGDDPLTATLSATINPMKMAGGGLHGESEEQLARRMETMVAMIRLAHIPLNTNLKSTSSTTTVREGEGQRKEEGQEGRGEESSISTTTAAANVVVEEGEAEAQEDREARLWLLARTMLTEEAVRCMVQLARLHEARGGEGVRRIYMAIIDDHLGPNATLPIDIPPWQRNTIIHLLQVSARRKVIFDEDRQRTLRALLPQCATLFPRVTPVLQAYIEEQRPKQHGTEAVIATAAGSAGGDGGGGGDTVGDIADETVPYNE